MDKHTQSPHLPPTQVPNPQQSAAVRKVENKFRRITEEHRLLDCSSVVLALSGGADSIVLLDLLARECPRRSIRLYALHVHHGIRGEEADRDAEFCRQICRERSIPLEVVRLNIPKLASDEGLGIEECARNHRYRLLEQFCERHLVDRIAVAHNADDNLETMLFHLTRGAATGGSLSIPPARGKIIRPLLYCTKEEILSYTEVKELCYVVDSTNIDPAYSRNFLRMSVIPELKKLNRKVCEAALRFSAYGREDDDCLDAIARSYLDCVDCSELAKLHPAILRRLIEDKYALRVGGTLPASQVEALLRLIRTGRNGSRLSLTSVDALIRSGRLEFVEKGSQAQSSLPVGYSHRLHLGENPIPEAGAILYIFSKIGKVEEKSIKEKQIVYKLFIHRTFDSATIDVDNLIIRNKSEGDRIRFGGMSRSVKKLFCDSKIPQEVRHLVPILCDKDEILWIPGFPVCDRVRPKDDQISDTAGTLLHLYFFSDRPNEY